MTNHKGMELMVRYQPYKDDRFMIRLPAKLDLAAPEADSDVESDEDMKCTLSSWLPARYAFGVKDARLRGWRYVRMVFPTRAGGWHFAHRLRMGTYNDAGVA